MFSNDHEQEQSSTSYQCAPIDLTSVLLRRDEFSEIIANMTKTLHMNTPEQTMNGIDIDDDYYNNENKLSHKPQLIEQLQTQLNHQRMRRTQPRNYLRILSESNTPAYWYKAPSNNHSVYFYDPNYQKYVQQQTNSPPKIKSNIHSTSSQSFKDQERSINRSSYNPNSSFPFTPRTKYMIDLYNTATNYHQQKQRLNAKYHQTFPNISQQQQQASNPSRLQAVPTLPPINTFKQRNEQEYNFLNINDTNPPSIVNESKNKI